MSITVGIVFLVAGGLITLTGIMLAVGEVISGRHSRTGSKASVMAGVDWDGIAGVINAAAAVVKAMADWPPPALFVLLGMIMMGAGVWIMAVKPMS